MLLALAVSAHGASTQDAWAQQVRLANELADNGRFSEAQRLYRAALDEASKSADDLRTGVVLYNLGRLFDRNGLLRDAEKAFLAAVAALRRTGGAEEGLLARSYVGLSAVYIRTGQYARSDALIREALEGGWQVLDADRASLEGNLGVILAHRGRFSEAEEILRRTIQHCENHPGEEVRETGAIAAASLAGILMRRGKWEEALHWYSRAIAALESVSAPAPATLAAALADFAHALQQSGDNRAAEEMYLRAMAVAEERLGPGHESVAHVYQRFSGFLRQRGDRRRARALEDAARRIYNDWRQANLAGHVVDFEALAAGQRMPEGNRP
jgi:tetratricopeptide (TPR) repeat protein